MKRFFGMMPSDKIKKEEHFRDKSNLEIIIQAGENGWSILYADGSSLYRDETKDTEDNFKAGNKSISSFIFAAHAGHIVHVTLFVVKFILVPQILHFTGIGSPSLYVNV